LSKIHSFDGDAVPLPVPPSSTTTISAAHLPWGPHLIAIWEPQGMLHPQVTNEPATPMCPPCRLSSKDRLQHKKPILLIKTPPVQQ
jgi:hypothetical protein